MSPGKGRIRPGQEADSVSSTAIKYSNSLPTFADDWQQAVNAIGDAYAVAVTTSADRYRRRIFLTLASAEKHALRAENAGHVATVVLVRLVPVVEGAAPAQATFGGVA